VRYRRLGSTELMVSEIGLDARALLAAGEDTAEVTIRAAIALGVTVLAWTVSDASEDVEPLIARAAGVDLGRLTLVARLDLVPAPEDVGPQVEAVASRLGSGVTLAAFPGALGPEAHAAFEEARERDVVRFAALDSGATIEVPDGRIAEARPGAISAALQAPGVACALVQVADPGDLRALIGEGATV